MIRKVGVVGTSGKIPGSAFMDTSPLLGSVGANSGNLVFQYAVSKSITEDRVYIGLDVPWDPVAVRSLCRVLVIPSANFLRENFDLTGFVSFLEKTELPLVFMGLGAQADSFDKTEFSFHPSIVRLMDLLRERCKIVGVRGAYTADLLSRFRIDNVAVIGCPSNFLNSDVDLPDKLAAKWLVEPTTLATTGDEPWPRNPLKRDAERKLIELTRSYGGVYVQQSVEPFVLAMRSSNPYQAASVPQETVESLRRALAPDVELRTFKQFMTTQIRLYFDVDQWLEDASRFDLSIGLRLHGNMVPFQAGCPAIWIHHDARTKELVDTMCLPSLSLADFLRLETVSEMKAASGADFRRYAERRGVLLQRYQGILGAAGVAHAGSPATTVMPA